MKNKKKVIISITVLLLVTLILLGSTYAYYRTRIIGNNGKNPSISVQTKKLEIVYGDNSEEIITGNGLISPKKGTSETDAVGSKTFTVTNTGIDNNYVVIIEDASVTKASDGSSTTFESNDFRYTLTCTKKDGTNCNSINTLTAFPVNGGILVSNDIKNNDVHTYKLTMWYLETEEDQSNDMGKTLQAKVNITSSTSLLSGTIENKFMTGISEIDNTNLAYNMIENSRNQKNGTTLLQSPITKIAQSIPGEDVYELVRVDLGENPSYSWRVADTYEGASSGDYVMGDYNMALDKYVYDEIEGWTRYLDDIYYVADYDSMVMYNVSEHGLYFNFIVEKADLEQTLSIDKDDLGSSYYYRGNVSDNYVTFADMCWRIVRVSGDGSVKLILENQDQVCSSGVSSNWDIPIKTGSTIKNGNFGYTKFSKGSLTSSDGETNTIEKNIMDYLHGEEEGSMATAFKEFQSTFTEEELSRLKPGNWCLADNVYNSTNELLNPTTVLDSKIESLYSGKVVIYDSYKRLSGSNGYQPTLKCNGTVLNDWDDNETNPTAMYVSAITADEVAYAGGRIGDNTTQYTVVGSYYLIESYKNFLTLSPSYFDYKYDNILNVDYSGFISNLEVRYGSFRPVVSLAPSTTIKSGDGTISNPYVID